MSDHRCDLTKADKRKVFYCPDCPLTWKWAVNPYTNEGPKEWYLEAIVARQSRERNLRLKEQRKRSKNK